MRTLKELGWSPFFANAALPPELEADEGLIRGRVARHDRTQYRIWTEQGERIAVLPGKWLHESIDSRDRPAVGDWVLAREVAGGDTLRIAHICERRSALIRKAAGEEALAQVLAANVDWAFLVSSLNRDFNPRRLERAMTMVLEAGASPVFVLTKADLWEAESEVIAQAREETRRIAGPHPIHIVSSLRQLNLDELEPYFERAATVVLLGSSGVGKSTLTNALLGAEVQETGAVRDCDDRGRHTTKRRDLLARPGGGFVIDTPGIRELCLWSDEAQDDLGAGFPDVESAAQRCRFHDCRHEGEPGCGVEAAILSGELEEERLESYRKLERERAWLRRKIDREARRREKARWKVIQRSVRKHTGRKEGWRK